MNMKKCCLMLSISGQLCFSLIGCIQNLLQLFYL